MFIGTSNLFYRDPGTFDILVALPLHPKFTAANASACARDAQIRARLALELGTSLRASSLSSTYLTQVWKQNHPTNSTTRGQVGNISVGALQLHKALADKHTQAMSDEKAAKDLEQSERENSNVGNAMATVMDGGRGVIMLGKTKSALTAEFGDPSAEHLQGDLGNLANNSTISQHLSTAAATGSGSSGTLGKGMKHWTP